MKLNPVHGPIPVDQSHRNSVAGSCRYNQFFRQTQFSNDQGMISCRSKRVWDRIKKLASIVVDHRSPSMNGFRSSNNFSSQSSSNRLVPQTHPQNGNRGSKFADQIARNSSFRGSTRAGRDHDSGRGHRANFVERDRVVAYHDRLTAQFDEVSSKVMNEAVVIVDQQQHVRPSTF